MTDAERVPTLISELTKLGHLKTMRDPLQSRDPELEQEVNEFLEQYPFMRRDTGYVAFLREFGAAVVWRDQDLLSLGIFGFDDNISTHLTKGEGDLIENGFLTFADLVVPLQPGRGPQVSVVGVGFGFDATGERKWGVYRLREERFEWYCGSFAEWLDRLLQQAGYLAD